MNSSVRDSLERLLSIPEKERPAILAGLPPEIRQEVTELLRFDEIDTGCGVESMIVHAARGFLADRENQTGSSGVGAIYGRYRVLRLVGEGSMGAVYEAEQEHPRRTVALKVIKPGLASPELVRRFEQECQALGRLQHPGIAQIYDAGSADVGYGLQPYFAMEYIRGELMGMYAERHALNTRQRLELIAKICDAVHHAHQRGLIHRDLKPGNILVDETGQPRILDFGVARVTDSDARATRQTDSGQLIGTLAYMSPEQVLADPLEIDIRCDVYALGVILFELLAGRLPYELSSRLHEAAHTICEEDPARLSSIDRRYRGDIETIAAKALEKKKSCRYASAADLASDIRRHLTDQPIVARPPTTGYQLRKFAIRHKALVGAGGAVFVVLLGGIVASTREAMRANRAGQEAITERDRATSAERRATEERDRATTERNHAFDAESKMLQERNRAVAEKERADTEAATAKAVNEFLQNDLLAQAGASAQSGPSTKPDPNMKVRTALDRAGARIGGKFDGRPLVEAAIRQTISDTYVDLGLFAEAQRHLERALELRHRTLGDKHPDTLASMNSLALLYHHQSKFAESERINFKLLEARREVLGEEHSDTLKTMNNLAESYRGQGKYAQAEPLMKRALELKSRVNGPENPSTLSTMTNLALLFMLQGKYTEAEPLYSRALEIRRRISGEEHPLTLLDTYSLSTLYWYQGRLAECEPLLSRLYDVQRRVLGDDHPDTLRTMNGLGAIYLAQREYDKSEALLIKVAEVQRRAIGEEHLETLVTQRNLAGVYREQGNYAQAEPLYFKILESFRRTKGQEHPETLETARLAGLLLVLMQKYTDAETLLRTSAEGYRKTNPNVWNGYSAQSLYGAALAGEKRYADAEALLISGFEGMAARKAKIRAHDRPTLEQVGQWVVQLYQNWNQPEKAAAWRGRTLEEQSRTGHN
jgi:tetratricopeptide (TPR) repeat protein